MQVEWQNLHKSRIRSIQFISVRFTYQFGVFPSFQEESFFYLSLQPVDWFFDIISFFSLSYTFFGDTLVFYYFDLWEPSMDFAWKSTHLCKYVCFGHHLCQSQYRFSFTQIYLTSCRFVCLFISAIAKKYAYTPFFFSIYLLLATKKTISMRRLCSICSCYLDRLECIVMPMS